MFVPASVTRPVIKVWAKRSEGNRSAEKSRKVLVFFFIFECFKLAIVF
jgi:hypothetical protein